MTARVAQTTIVSAAGAFAFGLTVFGLRTDAKAQSPRSEAAAERIWIDYDADESCPRIDAFVESVRAYTTRLTLAGDEGEAARRLTLKLRPRDGKIVGTLEIVARGGGPEDASTPRAIVGPDCETVARGMAIAVAVAVDSEAFTRADATSEEAPPPERAPAPPSSLRAPAARTRGEPAPAPPSVRVAVALELELTSAVVSRWLPVFGVVLEIDPFAERTRAPSWRFPRWLRPSLALGIRQSLPADIDRSTLTTTFIWTAGTLRACPVRLALAEDRLELTPCFEGDLGVLRAEASGSSDARRSSKLWLDAGLSAHADWNVSGRWFVGTTAGVVVPVSRNRFELGTGALISQAPGLAANFGVSGGLRF
ncbi:MAG: hypothetical protein KF901_32580 [Myxococcales bacterium]|nr:hypothetical protein [Myxococcales bacterium]